MNLDASWSFKGLACISEIFQQDWAVAMFTDVCFFFFFGGGEGEASIFRHPMLFFLIKSTIIDAIS